VVATDKIVRHRTSLISPHNEARFNVEICCDRCNLHGTVSRSGTDPWVKLPLILALYVVVIKKCAQCIWFVASKTARPDSGYSDTITETFYSGL